MLQRIADEDIDLTDLSEEPPGELMAVREVLVEIKYLLQDMQDNRMRSFEDRSNEFISLNEAETQSLMMMRPTAMR